MKSTVLWALAALNALLLATFLMQVTKPSTAMAQNARPGDYIMLPGEVIGGNGSVIYVIDSSSQQLSVLALTQNGKLEAMAPMNLSRVFNAGGGGGGNAGNGGNRKDR